VKSGAPRFPPQESALGIVRRRVVLAALCCGALLVLLDITIANAALPSLQAHFRFTRTELVWVINAFMLPFGGCLLLGGRLGDLLGPRKLWLAGMVLFTIGALVCSVSASKMVFLAARAVQGMSGAVAISVSLPLMISMCPPGAKCDRVVGIYAVTAACSGALGIVLGGVLVGAFDWRWLFLFKLPVATALCVLCLWLLPAERSKAAGPVDVWGAVTVTVALILAVHVTVSASTVGWMSTQTLTGLSVVVMLLLLFWGIERLVACPMVPPGTFRLRNLALANVVGVLWAAGVSIWFFVAPQYMQSMLGFQPMRAGVAFLPAAIATAAFAAGPASRAAARRGPAWTLVGGLFAVAAGLALFSFASVDGRFVSDVLPSMVLISIGNALAFPPLLHAAMKDVVAADPGLGSGLVNTSTLLGGAVGLAGLVGISVARADRLLEIGVPPAVAAMGGYRTALIAGSLCVGLALIAAIALVWPRAIRPIDLPIQVG